MLTEEYTKIWAARNHTIESVLVSIFNLRENRISVRAYEDKTSTARTDGTDGYKAGASRSEGY